MSERRDPTMDELRQVTVAGASDEAVVVGGMAVSILANAYGLESEEPCLTVDGDFFGDRLALERAAEQIRSAGMQVRMFVSTLDDQNTPNSGKLAIDVAPDAKPVEVDFLFRLDGLSADDIEDRAVQVTFSGRSIKVIHPLLLLENKINNLALYPPKRGPAGVNQARISIEIAKAHLNQLAGISDSRRALLRSVERIGRFARREAACFALRAFGLDVLACVPFARVPEPEFTQRRWPQIIEEARKRRMRFNEMWDRIPDPTASRFKVEEASGAVLDIHPGPT